MLFDTFAFVAYVLLEKTSGHSEEVEVLCASYDYLLIVKEKICVAGRDSVFVYCNNYRTFSYLIVFAATKVSKRDHQGCI